MSTHGIDEGTDELANNLNLNPEEALKLAQQEEEETQLRIKVQNGLKSIWDLGLLVCHRYLLFYLPLFP
jgi:hypothetical protein